MTTRANEMTDRARFGWVREASAVAMARGDRRRPPGGSVLSDLRMDGRGPGRGVRPGLLIEALLSHR